MLGVIVLAGLMAGVQPDPQTPTTIPEKWNAWCARCHGVDGSSKVSEPTVTVEPMDFTDCRLATPEPDADWELAIAEGGPAVGLSSQMPAFGDALSGEQVHEFINYIRSFCRETGWPHGNANFPRAIFTEKAFPENELIVLPMVTHRKVDGGSSREDVELRAIYERRVGRRAMLEIAVPLASRNGTGTSGRGVGDIEVGGRSVLVNNVARTFIASAGFDMSLPTGSEDHSLGHGTAVFEPYVAAGAILRDVYLQGQAKFELPANREKADREWIYHLYTGRDLSRSPDTWTIGMELNGENDELAVTPQVRKGLTKTGALGAAVGVRIPITERRAQGTRLVGYLLWEYLDPVRARP